MDNHSIEFSLNVFTQFSEFSDKNKIILKRLLGYLLCERQALYHCATDTAGREDIELNLIHASVDSLNSVNSENSAPFRENPIILYPRGCGEVYTSLFASELMRDLKSNICPTIDSLVFQSCSNLLSTKLLHWGFS